MLLDKDLELIGFRRRLKKTNFYEDVKFSSEKVMKYKKGTKEQKVKKTRRLLKVQKLEKVISEWVFDMRVYESIYLNKFKEIFSIWKEIKMPIEIRKQKITIKSIRFIVIDSEGKEYYMGLNRDSLDLKEYFIERRGNVVDTNGNRQFVYIIEDESKISLKTSYTSLLNKDKTNKDIMCSIHYDFKNQVATAKIQCEDKIVEIKYNSKGNIIDNEVMNYLLSIKDEDYFNDLIPVLKDFIMILGNVEELIFIESREKVKKDNLKTEEKVRARICIEDGEIFDYSPRKIEI